MERGGERRRRARGEGQEAEDVVHKREWGEDEETGGAGGDPPPATATLTQGEGAGVAHTSSMCVEDETLPRIVGEAGVETSITAKESE